MKRGHGLSMDTLALIAAATVGTSLASQRRARTAAALPPTPEQIAQRERDEWNAAVDRRKAEKRQHKAAAQEAAPQYSAESAG